ncbi:Ig-like domain-containing protein, partial [candidate division KSB1 bacterium]
MKNLKFIYSVCFFVSILFIGLLIPSKTFAQLDRWTFIGGVTISPTDTIYSMAFDPANPDTIFVGSTDSRVFYSINQGTSWIQRNLPVSGLTIKDLKVHPRNNNFIIAATDSGGIYISTDLGANWSGSNSGLTDTTLIQLEHNLFYPDTMFAVSADSGIFRSLNSGSTWAPLNNGLGSDYVFITSLATSSGNSSLLYAGTSSGKIYQSINNGMVWSYRGLITGSPPITSLIADIDDPDILYAGTSTKGVWKSTDAGVTFNQISVNLFTDDMNVISLAIDSSSTKKIYAGTDGVAQGNGVFQFTVGDTAFNAINTGLTNGKIASLEVHPNIPHYIFAGTISQGIFRYIGNRAPYFDPPLQDIQTSVGNLVTFTVTAVDDDPGETVDLVYNVFNLPDTSASFDSLATRVFSWTPPDTALGDNTIIFTVRDIRGGSAQDTVVINVNRNPSITLSDTTYISSVEDSLITFDISGSDADGDNITFSAVNLPTGAVYDSSAVNTYTFTWTPSFSQAGTYNIDFSVSDGRTGLAATQVTIVVANVNQAPFFNPPLTNQTVPEGNTLAFIVNGTDLDGDDIAFGILDSLPSGAGFDSLDTRRFSWIPTYDDSGEYYVAFTLNDGFGGTAVDSITITVTDVNRVPVFNTLPDTIYINEGNDSTFNVTATDADGDSVSYEAANLPLGAVFNKITGLFSWTPNFNQNGIYRVVFNAIDAGGGTSYEDIYLIVNQPPVWGPVTGQSTQEGVQLEFILYVSDADNDSLTFSVTDQPSNSLITFSQDSVIFQWTPAEGQNGNYAVTFTANDNKSGISDVIIPIQVSESTGQLPPIIIPVKDYNISENQLVIFQVVATDDEPQDSLTFGTFGSLPVGAEYDSLDTHIFQWTPDYSQNGSYDLIFSVSDKNSNTTYDSLTISVANNNRRPIVGLPNDTTFSENQVIDMALNISDPDSDRVSIIPYEWPNGSVIDSSDITDFRFKWEPSNLSEGNYVLRFDVIDSLGENLENVKIINIVIENDNHVPSDFSIISPVDENEITPDDYLIWEEASDEDIDDSLSYFLDISDNPAFSPNLIHIDTINVNSISGNTVSSAVNPGVDTPILGKTQSGGKKAFVLKVSDIPEITSLDDDSLYYWRVRAFDNRGDTTNSYTATKTFHLNLANDAPNPPGTEIYPLNEKSVLVSKPVFKWLPSTDPDHSDNYLNIYYKFELSDNDFVSVIIDSTDVSIDTLISPVEFNDNEIWRYRLKAVDDQGTASVYSDPVLFYVNTIPEPPNVFDLLSPTNNHDYSARPDSITFSWQPTTDPDPGSLFTYKLEISVGQTFSPEDIVLYIENIPGNESSVNVSTDVLGMDHYYWRITAIDDANLSTVSNSVWYFGLLTSVKEMDHNSLLPTRFEVGDNYPNPFNNRTVVRFGIPYISDVMISVYSATGQLVYSEQSYNRTPGYYVF